MPSSLTSFFLRIFFLFPFRPQADSKLAVSDGNDGAN